jgi:NAD(P)-dependent dehydrogenase (short-subunit alcohol dehydrogenase family)/acyl carrier protein
MPGPLDIAELSFDSFLALGQTSRRVQTRLRRKDDSTWLLSVHSRAKDPGSAWDLHAHGELRASSGPGQLDSPTVVRERCVDHCDAEGLYAALGERGLDYGPGFRTVLDVWTSHDEAIGELRDGQPGYECDPAVLDGALQLVAAIGTAGPGLRVPAGVDLIRVGARPVRATQALARTRSVDHADVALLAGDGAALVELSGVRFAAAAGEPTADQGRVWLYDVTWRTTDPVTPLASDDRRWLVLADDGGVGVAVAERIRALGSKVQLVERVGLAGLADILESGVEIVIDLRCLDASQGLLADSAIDHTVESVEFIRQLSLSGGALTPELWFVTRGAQAVDERECSDPTAAPIWGLGKVIPFENPALQCRMIDLDSTDADEAASLIIRECLSPAQDAEIGFAAGRRFVRRLVPAASGSNGQALRVRPGATYLITGGFGALGRAVATWLAGRGANHLALLGRHQPGPRAVSIIEKLRERGVHVDILQADVASRSDMEAALTSLRESGASLGGVVHAAGILDDGPVLSMDAASVRRVLAAKVVGAWNLDELTRDDEIDWITFFSSAASVLGSPGQANYCAANAFLDSFAHHLRARGRQALSINWGPWGEAGMASETREGHQLQRAYADLEPATALEIMGVLLARNAGQAVVLPFDLRNLLQFFPAGLGLAFFEEVNTADVAGLRSSGRTVSPVSRPDLDRDYVAPRNAIERRIAGIWQASLGVDRVGLFDRFFEFGGDSVFGNQVILEINRALGVTIDASKAFQDFTVANLAKLAEEYIAEQLAQMGDSDIERLLSDGDAGNAHDLNASSTTLEP